jgi:hypothetical protein
MAVAEEGKAIAEQISAIAYNDIAIAGELNGCVEERMCRAEKTNDCFG